MKDNSSTGLWMTAIVAIVAIVAMIVLVTARQAVTTTTPDQSIDSFSNKGNIAGQAMSSRLECVCTGGSTYAGDCRGGRELYVDGKRATSPGGDAFCNTNFE